MLGIYHAGELGVQARAGVQEEAQQSERQIGSLSDRRLDDETAKNDH